MSGDGSEPDDDDVPRYTIGLYEAEQRLKRWLGGETPSTIWPGILVRGPRAMRDDVALVLRELEGLKQFDPR